MKKERLVAFTDAVLAIVMTILILELEKPSEPTVEALWALKENFYAYTLSFFWLGSMWVKLHHIWNDVNIISTKVMWWNIVLLFFASLIPYTTSLVSRNFGNAVIQAFYGITVILLTMVNGILTNVLLDANKDNKQLQKTTRKYKEILILDIDIKVIGFVLAITIYPPAMTISVLIAAIFTAVSKKN